MGTLVNLWILYLKMEILGSLKLLWISNFNIATLEKFEFMMNLIILDWNSWKILNMMNFIF